MSKVLSTLSQKKSGNRFISRLFIEEADLKVTGRSEIELASPGFESSTNFSRVIQGFRQKVLAWIKEYVLSTSYLLISILSLVILPEQKTERGLAAHYLDRAEKLLKRFIDILFSGIGLLVCLPLFFIVGILIKLDSPGPIFFRQERVGMNRRKKERRARR